MRKIVICIIACIFLTSFLANISVYAEKEEITYSRIYIEKRPIVPVLTENGVEWEINSNSYNGPIEKPGNGKGKPSKPPKPPQDPEDPPDGTINKWALCIGISDYEGSGNDLDYCDDDAEDWKSFLNGQGYAVTILKDGQATAENIEAKINDLLSDEDGDDYVVFTYSGHGIKYKKHGSCMISTDLYLIPHKWFKSKFENADSPHIFFTFDACQIGGFQDSVTTNRIGAYGSTNQYSWEDSELENGVFTYYQIEGWETYDNFEEDSIYAIQGMEDWASQYYGLTVDPFYVDSYAGDMNP